MSNQCHNDNLTSCTLDSTNKEQINTSSGTTTSTNNTHMSTGNTSSNSSSSSSASSSDNRDESLQDDDNDDEDDEEDDIDGEEDEEKTLSRHKSCNDKNTMVPDNHNSSLIVLDEQPSQQQQQQQVTSTTTTTTTTTTNVANHYFLQTRIRSRSRSNGSIDYRSHATNDNNNSNNYSNNSNQQLQQQHSLDANSDDEYIMRIMSTPQLVKKKRAAKSSFNLLKPVSSAVRRSRNRKSKDEQRALDKLKVKQSLELSRLWIDSYDDKANRAKEVEARGSHSASSASNYGGHEEDDVENPKNHLPALKIMSRSQNSMASPSSPKSPFSLHMSPHGASRKRKILLLGVNWGGKTTVFKSVKVIFQGYSEQERGTFRDIIFSNILYSVTCLIEYALHDPTVSESEKKFIRDTGAPILDIFADFTIERSVLNLVPVLWEREAIKKAYTERNKIFHIPETAFWMDDIQRILAPDYVPTEIDVLRSRVKTTGIVYSTFKDNGYDIQLIDVGSERNERKKWYSCFDGATDLMFVVALDEYSMLCYEDNETNRLTESLTCWSEIINSHFFHYSNVNIFLVLNKVDLFRSKIESGCDLGRYFPHYTGGANSAKALSFITDMFLRKVKDKHRVNICITNALDMENMTQFWKSVISVPVMQESPMEIEFKNLAEPSGVVIREEWCWNLKDTAAKNSAKHRSYGDSYENKDYWYEQMSQDSVSDSRRDFFSVMYSDGCPSDLRISYYTDMTLTAPDRPNVLLQVHSFVLSTRCPKFLNMILRQKKRSESLSTIQSASFRNVSYGKIILPSFTISLLKYILDLVYSDEVSANTVRDHAVDVTQLCALNEKYRFTTRSEYELTDMLRRNYRSEDVNYSPRSPLKRLSKVIKRSAKKWNKQLKRMTPTESPEVHPLKSSLSFEGLCNLPDTNTTTRGRHNDLSEAFLQMNNQGNQYNYDLRILGAGSTIIRAHKFICHNVLPNFDGDSDSYMVIPFFSPSSYLFVLNHIYQCGQVQTSQLYSWTLTLQDWIHAIHISRLWRFDRRDWFLRFCVSKVSSLLTVSNVLSVLKEFEYDHLDLSVASLNSFTFDHRTKLSRLPVELQLDIFEYLATPPLTEKTTSSEIIPERRYNNRHQPIAPTCTERVLNYDALVFMLFTSGEFVQYLSQYYGGYLFWKTENMQSYGSVRQACFDFISKNSRQFQNLPEWKQLSEELKLVLRNELGQNHPCFTVK